MIDIQTINIFSIYWMVFALTLLPVLLSVKQPYGRHVRKGWGLTMPNKDAWIVMEIPSLIIIAALLIYYQNYTFISGILLALWLLHYLHRTLIFPFMIKTKGKQMPILIVFFGFFFNLVNASINGLSLTFPNDVYPDVNDNTRIIAGFLLFGTGMFINIYSDYQLIRLRRSSANGYKIPNNWLFNWISCPNYFGEIIEWTGFAVIAWNPAALSFAVWTMVNLIPRAIDHHKWYKNYFPEYPLNRKAVFPYIL